MHVGREDRAAGIALSAVTAVDAVGRLIVGWLGVATRPVELVATDRRILGEDGAAFQRAQFPITERQPAAVHGGPHRYEAGHLMARSLFVDQLLPQIHQSSAFAVDGHPA
jgi:hypothetical protein